MLSCIHLPRRFDDVLATATFLGPKMLRRRFEAEIAVACDFSRINFQANNTVIQTD